MNLCCANIQMKITPLKSFNGEESSQVDAAVLRIFLWVVLQAYIVVFHPEDTLKSFDIFSKFLFKNLNCGN